MKKHVGISNPCSEDRSKMTPTEAGVFCQKCAMEVYDFSKLSDIEIREVLIAKMNQPVCARITNKQEERMNQAFYEWQSSRQRHMQKAMIFSLIAVFGLTLFSCTSPKEEASIVEFQRIIQQSAVSAVQNGVRQITLPELQEVEEKQQILLEVKQHQEPEELLFIEHTDEQLYQSIHHEQYYQIDGGMSYSRDYRDYLLEIAYNTIETRAEEERINYTLELKAFPNPTVDYATLEVHAPDHAVKQVIRLVDLQGKTLSEIYDGPSVRGQQSFQIDLVNYPPGIYLIIVITDNQKEVIRLARG